RSGPLRLRLPRHIPMLGVTGRAGIRGLAETPFGGGAAPGPGGPSLLPILAERLGLPEQAAHFVGARGEVRHTQCFAIVLRKLHRLVGWIDVGMVLRRLPARRATQLERIPPLG